jgi:hypothetical protein
MQAGSSLSGAQKSPRARSTSPSTEDDTLPSLPKTTGLAKRMLSRSQTEPNTGGSRIRRAIDSRSNQLAIDNDAISSTVTSGKQAAEESTPLSSNRAHRTPASTPTRTYAGRSRSFLVSLPAFNSGSVIPDADEEKRDFEATESYTDLRTRWGLDISEDDPRPSTPSTLSPSKGSKGKGKGTTSSPSAASPSTGTYNELKSISELRHKGESRRFLDEVGYLFEGMDPKCGIGLRRARCDYLPILVGSAVSSIVSNDVYPSALEIVKQLCDANFVRKTKASDFLAEAWDIFRAAGGGNGDKVGHFHCATFAILSIPCRGTGPGCNPGFFCRTGCSRPWSSFGSGSKVGLCSNNV